MRPPFFFPSWTLVAAGNHHLLRRPFVSALGPSSTTVRATGACYGIHIDTFLHERLDICCMHSGYAAQRAAGAEY
jgi:hypothetical protein